MERSNLIYILNSVRYNDPISKAVLISYVHSVHFVLFSPLFLVVECLLVAQFVAQLSIQEIRWIRLLFYTLDHMQRITHSIH